jgi:crotonobetainyl-CoA:carnitine CoA-transferase CaiB-like acyl-CoA transferase
LSDTPPTFRRFAPALGEHSVEVLQSIGYSENQIAALEKAGVVRGPNLRP